MTEREREEGKLERERDIEKLVTCLTETEEDWKVSDVLDRLEISDILTKREIDIETK